jgi:hypothetical protein
MKVALQPLVDAGDIPAELLDTFAHVLLASLNEIALLLANAPDRAAGLAGAERAVDEVLARLLRPAATVVSTASAAAGVSASDAGARAPASPSPARPRRPSSRRSN